MTNQTTDTRALIAELVEALEALPSLNWSVEPATTDDGCYSNDPKEALARAAITKGRAALATAEQPQEPVAYLAWKDGKPCYEGDDGVCEEAVWPVDDEDDRISMPVYTHPAPKVEQPAHESSNTKILADNSELIARLRHHKDLSLCHEAAGVLEAQGREIDRLNLRAGNGYSSKIEALIAERNQLRAQVSALQADAERLDYLDKNLSMKMGWIVGVAPAGNISITSVIYLGGEPQTIRDAIDGARTGTTAARTKGTA